jgi:putative Holliday junction resolvase
MKEVQRRLLGIDYGLARLGLALSDERQIVALPYKVFKAERAAVRTVAALLKEIEAMPSPLQEIVVGLPLMMDGRSGLLADEVQHFVALLKEAVTIPVVLWDERLTTVQAERSLREGSLSRKKRSQKVDSVAAVLLLQSYLNYRQNMLQQP